MTDHVVVNLAEHVAKMEDVGSLDITVDDGAPVRLLPPTLWPEEFLGLLEKVGTSNAPQPDELGTALFGAADWGRIKAVIGKGALVAYRIVDDMIEHRHELLAGESAAS